MKKRLAAFFAALALVVVLAIPAEGQGPPETWKLVVLSLNASAFCVPLESAELLALVGLGVIVGDCDAPGSRR